VKNMKKILLSLTLMIPANAQVSVGVNIGPEPVCQYGFYPTYPYDCADEGFYDSSWFYEGIFIGAGPWFHWHDYYGHPRGFYGGYYKSHAYTDRSGHKFSDNGKVDRQGNFHGGRQMSHANGGGGNHGGRPR
jgi:hypothetical protein